MGTPEKTIQLLWEAFDQELTKAGLSLAEFGRWYYCEVNDSIDESEAEKFSENLKKQRQRMSASARMHANLTDYINKLYLHPAYQNRVSKIVPRDANYPEISDQVRRKMKAVSKQIDDMIWEDSEDDE